MSFGENWNGIVSEQRQHVNLSDYAHGIMESDIAAFQRDLKPSGFINRIIENYWEMSDASITLASERMRAEQTLAVKRALYKSSFVSDPNLDSFDPANVTLQASQAELIDLLVKDHVERLKKKALSHPKGPAFKIRLQNKNYRMLYVEPFDELAHYDQNVGKYIKAVIEDYSQLPLLEREAVFFRDNYETLKAEVALPVQSRRILKIKLKPNPHTGEVRVFDMKPYDLMTDTGANFHYIVGMSRPAGDKTVERIPASIRLSRIDGISVRPTSYGSGKITAAEKADLLTKIAERGVPYLVGRTHDQRVLLTPAGVGKYNAILHMRPNPVAGKTVKNPDGSHILTFNCSNTQIANYFLRFGKDALILEPADLVEEFALHHTDAAKAYTAMPEAL